MENENIYIIKNIWCKKRTDEEIQNEYKKHCIDYPNYSFEKYFDFKKDWLDDPTYFIKINDFCFYASLEDAIQDIKANRLYLYGYASEFISIVSIAPQNLPILNNYECEKIYKIDKEKIKYEEIEISEKEKEWITCKISGVVRPDNTDTAQFIVDYLNQ